MSELSHADIRLNVITKLRRAIIDAVDEIKGVEHLEEDKIEELNFYQNLAEKANDIPLIIKNERQLESGRYPDVEIFGGKLIIEIKKREAEFSEGRIQVADYVKHYPNSQFAIVTNDDKWLVAEIANNELTGWNEPAEIPLKDIIKKLFFEGVKLPLSTENIRIMFESLKVFEADLLETFKNHNIKETALYKAYKNIMEQLYQEADEILIKQLFMKHTLLEMIIASSLTVLLKKNANSLRVCGGDEIGIDIIPPYLNWWKLCLHEEQSNIFLTSLTENIYSKTQLLEWRMDGEKDAFRDLYEILIERDTRRKIGEYYTPLWLVEYLIEQTIDPKTLVGKTVVDPCCGSGTFLINVYNKKIDFGEDPVSAFKEIIGFDINPIAVSIARAELIIANIEKGGSKNMTPAIFCRDLATTISQIGKNQPSSFIEEMRVLENSLLQLVSSPVFLTIGASFDISDLTSAEPVLSRTFHDINKNLKVRSRSMLSESIKNSFEIAKNQAESEIIKLIFERLRSERNINAIINLIEQYGNGIWAVGISSLIAPYIFYKTKADVIFTNPPWSLSTKLKGDYGDALRENIKKKLEDLDYMPQVLNASNIASVFLENCLGIVKNNLGFVLPAEAVYSPNSTHGAGKIYTYHVIKNYKNKVIYIDGDPFQHGELTTLITLEKTNIQGDEEDIFNCCILEISPKSPNKDKNLSDITIELSEDCSYKVYIDKIREYFEEENLDIKLGIQGFEKKGSYIMGLKGGKERKYAGLIFQEISYDPMRREYQIMLENTDSPIKLPKSTLDDPEVGYKKKFVYMSDVLPFFCGGYQYILNSSTGEEDLEEFLESLIPLVHEEDKDKINGLIDEFIQQSVGYLDHNFNYVIYRAVRTFVSFVIPKEEIRDSESKIIIDSHNAILIVENSDVAYFYSAALNYLAYEVIIRKDRTFIRNQMGRPIHAIYKLNLSWNNEDWQKDVSKLSKQLHKDAKDLFIKIVSSQSASYLRELEKSPRFWRIIKIFREHVVDSDLELKIPIVSKKGKLSGLIETGEWRILTTIKGIEENKAKEVIEHFGDFNGLISAEQSEIRNLLSKKLSEKLYNNIVLKWRSEYST